ncbi:MAG: prephenate dehydratase [Candidatus Omnitrophota bacterium]
MMNLKKYRNKIDTLDEKIVSLLNERAAASQKIGQEKLKNKKNIYAPEREKEVLNKIKRLNQGPMKPTAFEAIYREIMSSCIALEKPLNIANLGSRGSFTSIAARQKFGNQISYISCSSIPEVFEKVEQGDCDYGVVPIENSTEGAVTPTFDLLVDSELKICSQVMVRVSHCLCSHASLNRIRKIYSNPQVFGQCRHWLQTHLAQVGQIWVPSTTLAAQMAGKEKNAAAICSQEAADLYKLKVVKKNIQDIAHNATRFLIIGPEDASATGKDRTSLVFSIKDKVGALHDMLMPFYRNKINLTKIESRPSKKKAWDYYFFVDLDGHRCDQKVKKALDELEGRCKYLKILGSYPA